jgi:hypothetical protein
MLDRSLTDILEELKTIVLNKGVLPSDLAENIFNEKYHSVHWWKDDGSVIGEIEFEEEIDNEIVKTKLRYFYHGDTLIRIEEVINGVASKLWDREERIELLETRLKTMFSGSNRVELLHALREVFPESYSESLLDTLLGVA